MNKEIDWHGPSYPYTRTFSIPFAKPPFTGITEIWRDNELVYSAKTGAWPGTPEFPVGWDERDALI